MLRGTWLSGGLDRVRLSVGLDDLKSPFQLIWFCIFILWSSQHFLFSNIDSVQPWIPQLMVVCWTLGLIYCFVLGSAAVLEQKMLDGKQKAAANTSFRKVWRVWWKQRWQADFVLSQVVNQAVKGKCLKPEWEVENVLYLIKLLICNYFCAYEWQLCCQ